MPARAAACLAIASLPFYGILEALHAVQACAELPCAEVRAMAPQQLAIAHAYSNQRRPVKTQSYHIEGNGNGN